MECLCRRVANAHFNHFMFGLRRKRVLEIGTLSGLSLCQKPPLRSITMTLRRVSPDALTLVINIQDAPTVMLIVGFCAVANIWYVIEQETL